MLAELKYAEYHTLCFGFFRYVSVAGHLVCP